MSKFINDNGVLNKVGSNIKMRSNPIDQFVTEAELEQGLDEKQDVMQFSTMPTASALLLGNIVQYVGETTNTYKNGRFYKCVSNDSTPIVYLWEIAPTDTNDVVVADGYVQLYDIYHTTVDSWLSDYVTFENGILTERSHPTSVIAAHYKISESDIENYDNRAKIKVHVADVSGTWSSRFEFKKASTGAIGTYTIPFGTIEETGDYEFELDLNYLTVYVDYGSGLDFRIFNSTHDTENDILVIDSIDMFVGHDIKLDGENLTEVLLNMDSNIDNATQDIINIKSKGLVVEAPNGNRYKIIVANDGTLSTELNYPDNILYIGNSLLLGFGNHGMASTTINDDYYAKVNDYIEDRGVTLTTDRVLGKTIEEATTDTEVENWLSTNLASKLSANTKMVIVQLGDNVNTRQQRAQFESTMRLLINYIRQHATNASIAWVGCWYSGSSINDLLIPVCKEYVIPFVDISKLNDIPEYHAEIGDIWYDQNGDEHTITTAGQASHPSNLGFTEIANRIISTLFE